MRTLCKMVVAFSVIVLLSSQLSAQAPRQRGGANNAARLAMNESVQKELKLSDEQVEKTKKAAQEVLDKFKDDLSKLGKDSTPEERAEVGKKVSDATYKALGDVLKPEQTKRLKQIEVQQQGLAFADTQKTLKISDEQKEKIKKLNDDSREKMRDIFKDAKDDPKAAREKMDTLRKETRDKEVGVLTDDQKKQWKELTGEPFEIKFEPRTK